MKGAFKWHHLDADIRVFSAGDEEDEDDEYKDIMNQQKTKGVCLIDASCHHEAKSECDPAAYAKQFIAKQRAKENRSNLIDACIYFCPFLAHRELSCRYQQRSLTSAG